MYEIINCVAGTIGIEPDRHNSCHLPAGEVSRKFEHMPIIVYFMSTRVRKLGSRQLNAAYVVPSFQLSPVYLNEHLMSSNKILLGRARRRFGERKLVYASFSNSKVLIRRREEEDMGWVTAMEQLDMFDK